MLSWNKGFARAFSTWGPWRAAWVSGLLPSLFPNRISPLGLQRKFQPSSTWKLTRWRRTAFEWAGTRSRRTRGSTSWCGSQSTGAAPKKWVVWGRKVLQSLLAGFPGSSAVKNLPAMRETRGRSLGQQYPPEKEMATHSSILFWEIPWTEEPGGYSPQGRKKSDTTYRLNSNNNNFIRKRMPSADIWVGFCIKIHGEYQKDSILCMTWSFINVKSYDFSKIKMHFC